MNILIMKLGATGDVVRTTPLLKRLNGEVTWITTSKNIILLQNLTEIFRCLTWEQRDLAKDRKYDLVINLEDDLDTGLFLNSIESKRRFGGYVNDDQALRYTEDSRRWFDLSLISVHGKERADQLKLQNRHTYQELIFEGLGFRFDAETYLLPEPSKTGLSGDVAIAPEAGPVWPMKNWAYYKELQHKLEAAGLRVNVLPKRASLLEHLGDVKQHRVLVGGDSLPMHLALGTGTRCVTLFTCTSPWEIHDYGLQKKLVSPFLAEFFYKRGFDPRATGAIGLEEVLTTVLHQLNAPAPAHDHI